MTLIQLKSKSAFHFSMLVMLSLFLHCAPSRALQYASVNYNFLDEGFLSPHTLQTVGNSELHPDPSGKIIAQKKCSQRAYAVAKNRMLRIMLHTNLSIPPIESLTYNSKSFDNDYPKIFSNADYIHAETDFHHILNKMFVALEDNRSKTSCKIILRLNGADLPDKIRAQRLAFKPQY